MSSRKKKKKQAETINDKFKTIRHTREKLKQFEQQKSAVTQEEETLKAEIASLMQQCSQERIVSGNLGFVPRVQHHYQRITVKDVLSIVKKLYGEEKTVQVCATLTELHQRRYGRKRDLAFKSISAQ